MKSFKNETFSKHFHHLELMKIKKKNLIQDFFEAFKVINQISIGNHTNST